MGRPRRNPECREDSQENRYREAVLKRLWWYVTTWQCSRKQAGFYDRHQKLIDEVLTLAECLPNPAKCPAEDVSLFLRGLLAGLTSPALEGLDEAKLVGIVEDSAKEVGH